MSDRIEERARFAAIRYANCWEDADILCAALRPGPGRRLLAIASGGDNAFALLGFGAEVVAADLSLAQLAMVELKRAAFRSLEHEELLAFLGVRPSPTRRQTFAHLAPQLPGFARVFWEPQMPAVEHGIIHAGKFERYFQLFRTRVLPLIHRRRTIEALLREKPLAERRQFYRRRWCNWRWRLLFRLFFSRPCLGRLGRDPEFFRYVSGSVAERILRRTEYALTTLATHDNPYLAYILTGNFGDALPLYLRPAMHAPIRDGLNRLTLVQAPVEKAAAQFAATGFDGFNLSDIFEYLSPELCRDIYGQLLAVARPGARLAYWNMLVPRQCPTEHAERIVDRHDLAEELFARDQAFFYSAFRVEECRT